MTATATATEAASSTARNVSTIVLLKAAQYPFLLLFLILIPRVMGPEIYGEYALLISIITITSSLIDYGGDTGIFGTFVPEFEIREEPTNIAKLTSNVLTLKAVIDLITAAVLFSILHYAYGDRFPIAYFLLIVAIALVRDMQTVPFALLFGLNELGKYTLQLPVRRALSLTFILILFHYYGLLGAMLSLLLVDSFLATLAFFWTRNYFRIHGFEIDFAFLRPYLSFGFINYLSWVLLSSWQRLGNPLIEYITKDSREVAIYDIPNQVFVITGSFILIVTASLIPVFTELSLTGQEGKLIKWATLIVKYLGILCMSGFGTFVLIGPNLVPIIIGPEYRGVFPNGVVLLLGTFPLIFAQLGYVLSMVCKKPGKYFQALCLALATFLLASILLIPRYASMGGAMATLISSSALAVVMGISFREHLLPCLADGFKAVSLGFVFVPFFFLRGDLIANLFLVICFGLAYVLLLFGARVLSLREIGEIFRAVGHQPVTSSA